MASKHAPLFHRCDRAMMGEGGGGGQRFFLPPPAKLPVRVVLGEFNSKCQWQIAFVEPHVATADFPRDSCSHPRTHVRQHTAEYFGYYYYYPSRRRVFRRDGCTPVVRLHHFHSESIAYFPRNRSPPPYRATINLSRLPSR